MEAFILGVFVAGAWNIMNLHKDFHYRIGGAILLCIFAGLLYRGL